MSFEFIIYALWLCNAIRIKNRKITIITFSSNFEARTKIGKSGSERQKKYKQKLKEYIKYIGKHRRQR